MKVRAVQNWHNIDQQRGRVLCKAMAEALPEQWRGRLDVLKKDVEADDRVPFWRKSSAWVERLQEFKATHGAARLWNLSDAEVCQLARDVSAKCAEWFGGNALDGGGWLTIAEPEALDILRIICETMGVDMPLGMMAAGVLARGRSDVWWRRALRKRVARVVEHGAIRLGVVNRNDGAYASDGAVQRRAGQIARNAAALEKSLFRNEAGQVYRLSELAALSVANPDVRRGELMVRIRGAEEFADAAGHPGLFLTMTCPSRFHAVLSTSKKGGGLRMNPKFDPESTPRAGQMWLRQMWARTRADLARAGVTVYGIRVAEPHHDGCPHWHALLWAGSEQELQAVRDAVLKHWLSDDGDERGAKKNRVNVKRMQAGGAAGYVAKYVAKNVGGSVNVDGHTDDGQPVQTGGVKGVERVDAWAATWGIRQFQTIGLPPVGVWRKLRAVTSDQIETARVCGDAVAWKAWGACQKLGTVAADFGRFIQAMGGVCLPRKAWALRVANRIEPGVVNGYGETADKKTAVGVEVAQSGRWLISKRVAWARVASDDVADQEEKSRASMARPWTRFNNCTARLGGQLRAALLGLERWANAPPGAVFVG